MKAYEITVKFSHSLPFVFQRLNVEFVAFKRISVYACYVPLAAINCIVYAAYCHVLNKLGVVSGIHGHRILRYAAVIYAAAPYIERTVIIDLAQFAATVKASIINHREAFAHGYRGKLSATTESPSAYIFERRRANRAF